MVRYRLKPGSHTIAFDFEGQRPVTTVAGKAGEVRFVRLDGMVWAWKSTFTWATESEGAIRERAAVVPVPGVGDQDAHERGRAAVHGIEGDGPIGR